MTPVGWVLENRDGEEGIRNYLGNDGIHAGDILQVRLLGGAWVTGRYEMRPFVDPPVLVVAFWCARHGDQCGGCHGAEVSVQITDRMVLRRPPPPAETREAG